MDKTIEIIVVAMVAIATAVGLLFMVRGESNSFLNFAGDQQSTAKCDLWRELGQTDTEKYRSNDCGTASTGGGGGGNPGDGDLDQACASITTEEECTSPCRWSGGSCQAQNNF